MSRAACIRSASFVAGLALALAAGGCSRPQERAAAQSETARAAVSADASFIGQTAEAPILDTAGAAIGTARLTEGPAGVLVHLSLNAGALPGGWHGTHFHGVGACDDGAQGFAHSGSHVGAAEGRHGLLNPTGPEPGDLPSIWAPASGAFEAELYSPFLTLRPEADGRQPIRDADGSALIIHAARDDQRAQPIGGAGARLACAVFTAG
ncbi:MAG: superoxide dismutase family protein [Alphaproteobacteria bacterium]|nr:superoxide dismutase family protein [Alphaproteobacteria bacterium]